MKVLVACEESQRTCIEFRKLGHEAYSCDIQKCSGGHPEWHIKGDCLPLLDGNCSFTTEGGQMQIISGKWDLIIAHPPCTFLAVSGNAWYNIRKYGDKAIKRFKDRLEAINFFMKFVFADCERIAIENPIGIMSSVFKAPTQIIQPYEFGEEAKKTTCLWLKGLPTLFPTKIVKPEMVTYTYSDGRIRNYSKFMAQDTKGRSKTFSGISKAFAEQWGGMA